MYTKGERSISQNIRGKWLVTIGGGLHTPRTTIGQFIKREDALLDVAAPDLYEALERLAKLLRGANIPVSYDMFDAKINARQAIAKVKEV